MRSDLTGLVLAGGASRRMGTDKAMLPIDGQPLVDRVAGRLATVCTTVVVSVGARKLDDRGPAARAATASGATAPARSASTTSQPGPRWRQIHDREHGAGPMAGIVAGLFQADTTLLAVVAVDMPHPNVDLLVQLSLVCGTHVAAVPVVEGVEQPLHAVYNVTRRVELIEAYRGGERSVVRALAKLDTRYVPIPGSPRWVTNLNAPSDVERFQAEGQPSDGDA